MNRLSFLFLFTCLSFFSCKPTPEIPGFDQESWKADREGCQGKRAALLPLLQAKEADLEKISTTQIVKLLGRPNKEELYRRSQRFFHYQISGGKGCEEQQQVVYRLRFTATDHLIEIEVLKK
ncbi:hypothetical protein [Persicobacter sp. CCB-QB2]|uniref:hypothetical protein n=1 Tax=Persicobacter sp. CCB-QB2 TaxID=1561025 RepID=UPI0006A9FC43|nr:hypothetical protein [Persicobacter sp. CCB-QB2]